VRLLISGAGGFIGSHLVEASVRAGHRVRCIVHYNSRGDLGHVGDLPLEVRSEIDVRAIDIRDSEAVDGCCEDVEGVFHLAALIGIPYSYVAPGSYVDVNVKGTMNFLNAVRKLGIKTLVHTSTSEVYGSAQYVPIDEKHPLVGQSPYSASKIAADKLVESYARSFELPAIIIRPFNAFGPRQSLRAVIPTLAGQLLDDRVSEVQAGTLDTVRDYTYVTDTAAAYLCALESEVPPGRVINIGTGVGHSISDIYEQLQQLAGIRKPISRDEQRVRPAQSEVSRLIADATLAHETLRWHPTVPFEDGLVCVLDDLRSRRDTQTSRYRI